jgi:glycine dehydrogenase subunit 1
MPFIPHTDEDIQTMLATIGVDCIDDLFDEIPANLRIGEMHHIPTMMSEMEINRLMMERANQDGLPLNFIGAGAYEHHIPAAVWQLTTRGEFYSAYTPYQAEASQGTLQLIYEYQTMMTGLTGMDVSNASLYDGASAVAEAVLMAIRVNRKSKSRHILLPKSLNPVYRKTVKAICEPQGIKFSEIAFSDTTGQTDLAALAAYEDQDITALVIPQINFFGVIEEFDALSQWAENKKTSVISVANPLLLSVMKPPNEWGKNGADIAVGEGQPLGAPLSSGGPYYGYMCCKQKHVRQMPGRIVGKTSDADGKDGFVLTLQAREQHIRRSKATSNICTNQGLVVTASTIHMALLGEEGLARVASQCYQNTHKLRQKLIACGLTPLQSGECFHEFILPLDKPAAEVLNAMAEAGISAGYNLERDYPEFGSAILVCATETKSDSDLDHYVDTLIRYLSK